MTTIAVTAATGQLGTLVVDELLSTTAPSDIVAVVRNAAKAEPLAAKGVQVRVADYTDPAALQAALAGVDVLLLISGSEVGQRATQHKNVIDAAVAAGVGRIAYTSVLGGDSPLILAPEHVATEGFLAESGLPFTILRHGWYTENYVDAAKQAAATGSLVASVGEGRVSSATRADYAAADAAVLTGEGHEGKVYELSGDTAWDFAELAAAISTVTGTPVEYSPVSPDEHTAILTGVGLDAGTAGFVVALDGNIRDGLLDTTTGDLSGLIGRPTTPLVDGLRAAL